MLLSTGRYALKAEASGKLTIDPQMVRRLGISGLTEEECKIASALFLARPVVPTEAAMHMLHIPIVQMSTKVVSVNTSPSATRDRRVSRNNKLCLAPVDKYRSRPTSMEDLTLYK